MSLTNLGGPRARKLIKVKFVNAAQSQEWYVWAYNPDTGVYAWSLQNYAGFEFAGHAGGTIFVPAGWTTADLALTVCATPDGVYVPYLLDGTNDYINAPESTVIIHAEAGQAYEMRPNWFGAGPFCKLHSLTDNQAGDQVQSDKEVVIWMVA
jgi:hypothetical protein